MTPDEAYCVLGLDKGADAAAIKSAYRHAAQWCHPDKNADNKVAEEAFKRVTEAYGVLKPLADRFQPPPPMDERWAARPTSSPRPPPQWPRPINSGRPAPRRRPVNWGGAALITGGALLLASLGFAAVYHPRHALKARYLGPCAGRAASTTGGRCLRLAVTNPAGARAVTGAAISLILTPASGPEEDRRPMMATAATEVRLETDASAQIEVNIEGAPAGPLSVQVQAIEGL